MTSFLSSFSLPKNLLSLKGFVIVVLGFIVRIWL